MAGCYGHSKESSGSIKGEKMLHAGFFLGLFFDPDDGGSTFFRSVNRFSQTIERHIQQVSTNIMFLDIIHRPVFI
jgi:hypothetical protein